VKMCDVYVPVYDCPLPIWQFLFTHISRLEMCVDRNCQIEIWYRYYGYM